MLSWVYNLSKTRRQDEKRRASLTPSEKSGTSSKSRRRSSPGSSIERAGTDSLDQSSDPSVKIRPKKRSIVITDDGDNLVDMISSSHQSTANGGKHMDSAFASSTRDDLTLATASTKSTTASSNRSMNDEYVPAEKELKRILRTHVSDQMLSTQETSLPTESILRSQVSCPEFGQSSRSITFGNVEIKEYPRALGDNPSCASGGPPISLGSKAISESTMKLEDFETMRTFNRRKKEQMIAPPHIREDWLREAGYGTSEIYESIKSAARIKRQREKSISGSIVAHEIMQKARRTFCSTKPRRLNKTTTNYAATSREEEDREIDPLDES